MSFQVGETVGRYRIVEQLGQGGMATVFKAYHAELDRYVALKVLHPAFLEDSNFLARFQREARLVAKMDQSNIVPIYDYSEHEGRPYLVMKFIEGETLKSRLSRGDLATEEIKTIVDAVGAALSYAHKQGILHRDMKPSNVLLANDGQVYLADFGLARIAQSGESTLTSDMIVGTPQYISPEQALGKKDLDEGTDIYSLGVMLYELVVGVVPFSADTPFSIIHDHIYTPLPMPRAVNPAVSKGVERVLLKALAKERNDRYKDVKSLTISFKEALQAGETTTVILGGEQTVRLDSEPEISAVSPANEPSKITSSPESTNDSLSAKTAKKNFPWMWIALSVISILACFVLLGALRSLRLSRNMPTQAPTLTTVSPLKTPKNVIDITEARQAVDKNPNDPDAHLHLALAYSHAEMPELEQDSISTVIRLAIEDEGYLWEAARLAAGNGAWLSAARLALEGADLHLHTNPSLPDDFVIILHESIYKAMNTSLAGEYFQFNRVARVDEPLAWVAEARHIFYTGNEVRAQEKLDEFLLRKPGFAEALLLQAEISSLTGDFERARLVLEELGGNPDARDWMLQEANIIERNLP